MATSDLPDPLTAPSAGASSTALAAARGRGTSTAVVVAPPAQARPLHDDLPSAPVRARGLPPLERSLVEELVAGEVGSGELRFERPVLRAGDPAADEVREVPTGDSAEGSPEVPAAATASPEAGRGTPLQALAGWGGALVLGVACWAGALAAVSRVV